MNQTEQAAQITELRRQAVLGNIETLAALIGGLSNDTIEQGMRIERLETAVLDFHERVGKLEAKAAENTEAGDRLWGSVIECAERVDKLWRWAHE